MRRVGHAWRNAEGAEGLSRARKRLDSSTGVLCNRMVGSSATFGVSNVCSSGDRGFLAGAGDALLCKRCSGLVMLDDLSCLLSPGALHLKASLAAVSANSSFQNLPLP